MSTVFIFGAGASAFGGDCSPKSPPVGPGLFAELSSMGGVASTVSPDLRRLFNINFEQGMAQFQLTREEDAPSFLREMALFFLQFDPGPQNAYRKLARVLHRFNSSVAFATLNYDLMLEYSLSYEGKTVCYNTSPKVGSYDFEIIKPHGSCNFLPELERPITGLTIVTPPGAISPQIECPIKPARSPDDVRHFCALNDTLSPVMSLYAKGKRLLTSGPFMKMQHKRYNDVINKARRIIAIGVAVNEEDDHIWAPMSRSDADMYFVNPDTGSYKEWARANGRPNVYHLANGFCEAVPRIKRLLLA